MTAARTAMSTATAATAAKSTTAAVTTAATETTTTTATITLTRASTTTIRANLSKHQFVQKNTSWYGYEFDEKRHCCSSSWNKAKFQFN